jgi:hypothetical protein
MTQFGKFSGSVAGGSGDVWAPKEHPGVPIIVKARAVRNGVVTSNSPEGTDALCVDLVDLTTGEIHRDVLWFGGAVLDSLTEHVGSHPVVIKFMPRLSKQGRPYVAPEEADPAEIAYAQQWITHHGDPFVNLAQMAPAAVTAPAPVVTAPAPVVLPALAAPVPVATLPTMPSPGPTVPVVVPGSVYQAMVNAGLDVSKYVVG